LPRAAFAGVTGRLRKEVSIPLITSNRINMPDVAEAVLARGDADLVSMARPMLADAELVNKAFQDRSDEINTCIGCNQACLDHTFSGQMVSCLVNARACRETEIKVAPADVMKRIAVVGAGPSGPSDGVYGAFVVREWRPTLMARCAVVVVVVAVEVEVVEVVEETTPVAEASAEETSAPEASEEGETEGEFFIYFI
jgi:hypothetical protein